MERHMRKVAAGACAAGVAFTLSACTPAEETPEAIYGPPEDFGSQEYDPSSDMVEALYGPPPDFRESEVGGPPSGYMAGAFADPEFDPDANMNEDVYGPPAMFGIDEDDPEEE